MVELIGGGSKGMIKKLVLNHSITSTNNPIRLIGFYCTSQIIKDSNILRKYAL